jgi:hypothetical protein
MKYESRKILAFVRKNEKKKMIFWIFFHFFFCFFYFLVILKFCNNFGILKFFKFFYFLNILSFKLIIKLCIKIIWNSLMLIIT